MLSSPGLQKELKEELKGLSQDAAVEAEISDRFGIYPVESKICLAVGFTLKCFLLFFKIFLMKYLFVLVER